MRAVDPQQKEKVEDKAPAPGLPELPRGPPSGLVIELLRTPAKQLAPLLSYLESGYLLNPYQHPLSRTQHLSSEDRELGLSLCLSLRHSLSRLSMYTFRSLVPFHSHPPQDL